MGEMVKQIAALQDYERYQDLHWEGSFEDYLQIVRERPQVTRLVQTIHLIAARDDLVGRGDTVAIEDGTVGHDTGSGHRWDFDFPIDGSVVRHIGFEEPRSRCDVRGERVVVSGEQVRERPPDAGLESIQRFLLEEYGLQTARVPLDWDAPPGLAYLQQDVQGRTVVAYRVGKTESARVFFPDRGAQVTGPIEGLREHLRRDILLPYWQGRF